MSLSANPLRLMLIATCLLAGCSSPSPKSETETAASQPRPETCDTAPVQNLVGKPGSTEMREQARERAGAQRARLIGPDDMVTLDYDSQRLNLWMDASGIVQRVSCG